MPTTVFRFLGFVVFVWWIFATVGERKMSATIAREIPSAKGVPHRKGSALLAYLDAAGMRGSLFPSFFFLLDEQPRGKKSAKTFIIKYPKNKFSTLA